VLWTEISEEVKGGRLKIQATDSTLKVRVDIYSAFTYARYQ